MFVVQHCCAFYGSVVVFKPGWIARSTSGCFVLRRFAETSQSLSLQYHARDTAVFGIRLMGIASEMGERLARTARSVSIKDRRDFSCAVFDGSGMLLANAPHVPVHLGSMGESLRALLATQDPQPGEGLDEQRSL